MFSRSLSKDKKYKIDYHIRGLSQDLERHRNDYYRVCNDKETVLRAIINHVTLNVDAIGDTEFKAYMDALGRVKSRLHRTENRYDDPKEEQYYNKRLRKLLKNELKSSSDLLNEYNHLVDVLPFIFKDPIIEGITKREGKRKSSIKTLIQSAVSKK